MSSTPLRSKAHESRELLWYMVSDREAGGNEKVGGMFVGQAAWGTAGPSSELGS